jgi:hypothetical protein
MAPKRRKTPIQSLTRRRRPFLLILLLDPHGLGRGLPSGRIAPRVPENHGTAGPPTQIHNLDVGQSRIHSGQSCPPLT